MQVFAAIVGLLLLVSGLALATGSYVLAPGDLLQGLRGNGPRMTGMVLFDMRLPRLAGALLVGAALGVSGAIFQTLCRNSLASPDVMGFTTGSASGAMLAIQLFGQPAMAAGALAGGVAAGLAVQGLSRGRTKGDAFVLAGVGLTAMLAAFNEYLLTRADLEKAETAKTWLFGNLADLSWQSLRLLGPGVVLLLGAAAFFWPRLRLLAMGDDLAIGLGLPARSSRLWLAAIGIGLSAFATALAGPVHFLALAAAPLARRLLRSADNGMAASALMGALLLAGADFLAQRLMAPFQIPVGLVTGALGGGYLVFLLTASQRKGRL